MNSNSSEKILDDSSFQSVLVACLERLERGESLDREAILKQHPEFAGPLEEFLDDQAMLRKVASGVRESLGKAASKDPAIQHIDETLDSRSEAPAPAAGDVIRYVGEYEVLEEIARGGMGVVFRARHQKLNRTVALKMILSGRLAGEADVQRFLREAQADDRLLAAASKGEIVRLWNVDTGREVFALEGHEDEVTTVAFSPDGARLATASADQTVRIWDLARREASFTLTGPTNVVACLAFQPDGRVLVSGSDDKSIKLWDAKTGEQLHTITEAHSAVVAGVAFTPDGKHLASGSHDKTIRIWDFETKEEIRTLQGHGAEVTCVAFSPDGQRLISGSTDQTLREWDWNTGREIHTWQDHTGAITDVGFSPGGDRAISSSADKTVKIWEIEGGRP